MKRINEILKNILIKNNSPESKVLEIVREIYPPLDIKNITIRQGILSFPGVSSGVRLKIILEKSRVISRSKEIGVYLRDIL